MGYVGAGVSESCRGGVGYVGVGWVMQGWVGHAGWGGVGHVGMGCIIQGWSGLSKNSLNNLICHKLGVLSFLLKNYCQLLSG